MVFSLSSWSVFYKKGDGEGHISCDNGQKAKVKIKVRGGGVSFGKSTIKDATANFSEVDDISELYGSYASAEAHAGAKKSSAALVMTKGEVSMSMAGIGKGINIGFAFSGFTISPQK
jgi:hypothetical protein